MPDTSVSINGNGKKNGKVDRILRIIVVAISTITIGSGIIWGYAVVCTKQENNREDINAHQIKINELDTWKNTKTEEWSRQIAEVKEAIVEMRTEMRTEFKWIKRKINEGEE